MKEMKEMKEDRINQFIILDLFRGVAALLVFIGHLRSLMFVDYDGGGLAKNLFYASTSFGHEAVIIFFVLSGFFITRSILFKLERDSWCWKNYISDRSFRILVVLIPAVLITFIIDSIGVFHFGNEPLYLGSIGSTVIVDPIVNNLYLINVLSNIILIPTEIVSATGSNASLWSISFEFWAYMLFPLALFCFVSKSSKKMKLLFIFLSLLILILIAEKGLVYFILWCFGASVAFIIGRYNTQSHSVILKVISTILFITTICFSILGHSNDFILALSFSMFMLYNSSNNIKSKLIQHIAEYFSKISYSLYAIHLPLVLVFLAMLDINYRLPFNLMNMLYFIFIFIFIICIAKVFWYLFERNTNMVKDVFKIHVNKIIRC